MDDCTSFAASRIAVLKHQRTAMNDWIQSEVVLPAYSRGCHLITSQILLEVPEVREFQTGLMHVFIRHTSASLTLNENADPDVLTDMNMAFNKLAPESMAVHSYLRRAR